MGIYSEPRTRTRTQTPSDTHPRDVGLSQVSTSSVIFSHQKSNRRRSLKKPFSARISASYVRRCKLGTASPASERKSCFGIWHLLPRASKGTTNRCFRGGGLDYHAESSQLLRSGLGPNGYSFPVVYEFRSSRFASLSLLLSIGFLAWSIAD